VSGLPRPLEDVVAKSLGDARDALETAARAALAAAGDLYTRRSWPVRWTTQDPHIQLLLDASRAFASVARRANISSEHAAVDVLDALSRAELHAAFGMELLSMAADHCIDAYQNSAERRRE